MKRLLLVLVVLTALLPALVSAQIDPVTLTVRVGLGGVVKQNAWAPAVFTIANNGNDLQGVIEWRWDSGGEVFAQTLDLPRGANKQIVLPVRGLNFVTRGTARFLVGNNVIAQTAATVDNASTDQQIIALIGAEGQTLAVFGTLPSNGPPVRPIQLTLDDLPDRSELLDAVNWLFLTGDTSGLRSEQQSALRSWVATGGHLVINGARPQTAQGLGDLAPATVGTTVQTIAAADVVTQAGAAQTESVPLLHLQPRPTAMPQTTSAGVITMVRASHGSGTVTQAGVDLAQLGATPEGLAQLLGIDVIGLPTGQPSDVSLLEQALRLPALRLPSLGALLAFLLCYIILVGPINYLFLRHWDRREWAYFTIPLTVVVFTIGAYLWGAAGRGSGVLVNELAIIRTASGATTGQATTEVGIYSPVRRAYTFGFPADALVSQSVSSFRRTVNSPIRTLRTESTVEVPNVLVDVGSLQSFTAAHASPVPSIRATRTGGPSGSVLVHNDSTQILQDVIVVQDQNAVRIGTLQPGAEQRVTLPLNDFIAGVNMEGQGVINRQAVLTNLVEGFGLVRGVPAPVPPSKTGPIAIPAPVIVNPLTDQSSRLSVFAWLPTSRLPLQIDGHPVSTQGETLLIVGVDNATDR